MSAEEKKNVSFSFVYNRRNTTDGLNFFFIVMGSTDTYHSGHCV